MFAVNVAINLPVKNLFRQFTYSVPEALQFIDSGWRVVIPFSCQKVEGFVVERVSLPSDEVLRSKLKPVEAAYLANLAASVGVAKLGTYAVSKQELQKVLTDVE